MSTKNSILSRRWQWARYAGSVIVILALALLAFFTSMHSVTHAQSGDWPTYLGNNAHTGYNAAETIINPSTVSKLKVHWRHKYSAKISTQPIVANSMLYWGSYDGIEHASSLTNGADVWATNLGLTTDCRNHTQGVLSTATVATVTIQGNPTTVVFVGGGDNNLYALDATTGTVLWKTLLGSSSAYFMYSSPTVYNGSVYIGVSAAEDCLHVVGQMVQLDASTGIIQHTFNTVPTNCLGGSVWTSPTIDETSGILYFSTGEKSACKQHETMVDALIALNATNLSLIGSWQVPASEIIMDGDFGSSPTLFQATIGGTLHQMVGLANKNGIYYAFDRSSISAGPLWEKRLATTPGPTISSSAWDGTDLYVSAGTTTLNNTNCAGSLSALDPATGTPLWRDCLPFDAFAPVTAVPGLAELADDNDIRIVDVTTGNLLFDYHQKTNFLGPGTISNGVLYQADMGGDMYAFGLYFYLSLRHSWGEKGDREGRLYYERHREAASCHGRGDPRGRLSHPTLAVAFRPHWTLFFYYRLETAGISSEACVSSRPTISAIRLLTELPQASQFSSVSKVVRLVLTSSM